MPTLHIDADDLKRLLSGETIEHPATGLRVVLDKEAAEPKGELDCDNPLPAPVTIDITPRGMTTPEGIARATEAICEWDASAHEVANLASDLLKARTNGTLTGYDWEEIEQAVKTRDAKQENMLRAVAGVPPAN